jgi:hypothetical protein
MKTRTTLRSKSPHSIFVPWLAAPALDAGTRAKAGPAAPKLDAGTRAKAGS